MQNFKNYNPATGLIMVDIGTVYSRQPVKIEFEKEPTAKTIINMQADCGCSSPSDSEDKVIVYYTPGDVPEGPVMAWNHEDPSTRSERPSHRVQKGVTITYSDQTSDRIYFTATVMTP